MRFLIGACALIWAVSAPAVFQASVEPPLTLPQAIALVLDNNLQLQAAGFDTRAAAARIRRQLQTKPWTVNLEMENLGGTGRLSGVDELETTLSLGRVLELGNKPQRRGAVASTRAAVLSNEQDAERLDLLAETANRFLDIAVVQARQVLAKERIALRKRTLQVVQHRFRAGKAAEAERSRARIRLARAELALEETEHQLTSARSRLSVLWGEAMPSFQQVRGDLRALEPVPDAATLERLVEQNPSLVRFATLERLAEARLRLADASRRPDIEFRGGVKHYNGPNDVGLVFSVKIPLGSRGRAKPLVDEATALAAREPLLARNQHLALRVTLFALLQELSHARHVIDVMQERIIPAAESALADYTKGYGAGRYSLLELTQAQDTLLQARLEELDAAADYRRNHNEIDRLTGGALSQFPTSGGAR